MSSCSGRRGCVPLLSAALLALWGSAAVALGPDPVCDVRLAVELDPALPSVHGDGFLSSLLNRHFNYRLELLRQDEQDPADIEVRLTGPGPEYRCLSVIETMRRDARVQSIRIESLQAATQVGARSPPQLQPAGAGWTPRSRSAVFPAARTPLKSSAAADPAP